MEKYYYLCSMKHLKMMIGLLLLTGCGEATESDDAARQVAQAWGDAYFNCDYKDAGNYVTQESQKWLQYAASNTTEQELELLQEVGGASIAVSDWFEAANDTLRLVTLTVTNFLTEQHQTPTITKEGTYKVAVVKRDAGWQVRMEGLPQNEKQNRD